MSMAEKFKESKAKMLEDTNFAMKLSEIAMDIVDGSVNEHCERFIKIIVNSTNEEIKQFLESTDSEVRDEDKKFCEDVAMNKSFFAKIDKIDVAKEGKIGVAFIKM